MTGKSHQRKGAIYLNAEDWDKTSYIVDFTLNDQHFVKRPVEIEHERAVALGDLIAMNRFQPVGDFQGPFRVSLGMEENRRLLFDIADEHGKNLTQIKLSLSPFKRIIKDYFAIYESYQQGMKSLSPTQLETIDMARRGLHNDGADELRHVLKDKIILDKHTARRLFTLICVLHI